MTPEERTAKSLGGQIGANRRWAHEPDRTAATAKARAAFLSKFEQEADPEGVLPIAERLRRAENLRKAHFARLRLLRVQAKVRRLGACVVSGGRLSGTSSAEDQARDRATNQTDEPKKTEPDKQK